MSWSNPVLDANATFAPFSEILQPIMSGESAHTARKMRLKREKDEASAQDHSAGFIEGRNAGFEAGYKQGSTQGYEDAKSELINRADTQHQELKSEISQRLLGLDQRIEGELAQWSQAAEAALEGLIGQIALKILGKELALSRESVLDVIHEAIKTVADAESFRITVNPIDLAYVQAHHDEFTVVLKNLKKLDFFPSEAITGGARIETEKGSVDASVDTQIAALENFCKPEAEVDEAA